MRDSNVDVDVDVDVDVHGAVDLREVRTRTRRGGRASGGGRADFEGGGGRALAGECWKRRRSRLGGSWIGSGRVSEVTGDGRTGGCCGGVSGGRRAEGWCECECEEGWTGRGCARGCGRVRLVLGAGDGVDRRGWTCRIGGVE